MNEKPLMMNPRELLAIEPDLLPATCDRVAHTLLAGESLESDDPFSRMAAMILSRVLLDVVIHARAKEETPTRSHPSALGRRCDP